MANSFLPALDASWSKASAVLSPCTTYRYSLTRRWSTGQGAVVFIGLNPSTADATQDDPTIRKCIVFAKRWGYAELRMVNLFAFRSTDPSGLLDHADPVGPDNDAHLLAAARSAALVVASWGNHGSLLDRSRSVRAMLPDLHGLRINKSGEPAHPLYLPGRLKPTPLASVRSGRTRP
jgi:hypothetical protein